MNVQGPARHLGGVNDASTHKAPYAAVKVATAVTASFAHKAAGARGNTNQSDGKAAILFVILFVAVALRLIWRLHMGGEDFWINGYSFFYDLACSLTAGHGLNLEGDRAMRMPVYPLFLALTTLAGKNYFWIIFPQAILGAGTVLCAYLLGRELFGMPTGFLASAMTALYPYYVVHDTALQDTSMFTFLTAFSVFLLLRAKRTSSPMIWTIAGFILGAAVLTRQTLLPFAAVALLWIGLCGKGSRHRKMARLLVVATPLCLMIGLWVVRNYIVVGAPIMTSEFGRQLWNAHNAKTFSHYPNESIDRSEEEAFHALGHAEQQKLDGMSDEILRSNWFRERALDYMRANPLETVRGAGRKVLAGFSWNFNPRREPLVEGAYALSYGPISILGVLGMALTWRQWRAHSLIYLLFLTFAGVTAVFWAHSSHRSYLDLYWIVFAAYVLQGSALLQPSTRRLSWIGIRPRARKATATPHTIYVDHHHPTGENF